MERYLPDTPVCFANQKSDDLGSNVYMVNTDEREGFERCVALMVRKKRKHLALMIDKGRPSLEIIRTGFMDGLRKAPGLTGIVYTNIPATIEGGEKLSSACWPNTRKWMACSVPAIWSLSVP